MPRLERWRGDAMSFKPEPTPEELAARRARLQHDLFRLLDERRRMRINERHRDYWRWKEQFDAAKGRLAAHDATHGEGG